ncbi:helix-turn-helix transcriptional regulator, partial [Escherichia coli]
LNRLIRCVCGKKIGPDPRNFNQRVSLGRNDLLIRTFLKKDVLIKDILFYLNNNYREKITLEQLSKKFRASVSYICHEFTKEYRISPINYVIQRRMTEAKWSLTNTELSQAEISWRVGYENVDHFAKLFLRHVGCSPSDYRRQFKNCFAEQEILSEFPQPVSLVG